MNGFLSKRDIKTAEIFIGATLVVTLSWIIFKRLRKPKTVLYPGEIGIDLERYKFSLPSKQGDASLKLERVGGSFAVRLQGKYLGRVFKSGNDWVAKGKALKPYLSVIAQHLPNPGSRNSFNDILAGVYPEIKTASWKTPETLEVVLNQDTDIEIFTTFLKDELPNLVEFDEYLELLVKKDGDGYFISIPVN